MNTEIVTITATVAWTVIYAIYVQCSVGNVWYRSSDNGTKSFQPLSLLNLMVDPLSRTTLWSLNTLDLNYPFFVSTGVVATLGLNWLVKKYS